MLREIQPRKVPMWRFFDDHPEASGFTHLGRLSELRAGDRTAAELFIAALRDCKQVLDIGCGAGLPALYVAPHVKRVIGLDAAPSMVAAARQNAAALGLTNVAFAVGGADGLPFPDAAFDGVSLCGVLESMDWDGVQRTMSETCRVLRPGGRVAILDRDWAAVLRTNLPRTTAVRVEGPELVLHMVERCTAPDVERHTRYAVIAATTLGRRLLRALGDQRAVPMLITVQELRAADIRDAWYDEGAQFTARTLAALVKGCRLREVRVETPLVWGAPALFLTARKAARAARVTRRQPAAAARAGRRTRSPARGSRHRGSGGRGSPSR